MISLYILKLHLLIHNDFCILLKLHPKNYFSTSILYFCTFKNDICNIPNDFCLFLVSIIYQKKTSFKLHPNTGTELQ